MRAWIRRGVIFDRCRERGYGNLPRLDRPIDGREEVDELADETVGNALNRFRTDVLMKRNWDYRRGATLRTYFIGQCLIRFPNVYRRWFGHELRRGQLRLVDQPDELEWLLPRGTAPDGQVLDGVMAALAMAGVKDPAYARPCT